MHQGSGLSTLSSASSHPSPFSGLPPGPRPQGEAFQPSKDEGTPQPEPSLLAVLALISSWPPIADRLDSWLKALDPEHEVSHRVGPQHKDE